MILINLKWKYFKYVGLVLVEEELLFEKEFVVGDNIVDVENMIIIVKNIVVKIFMMEFLELKDINVLVEFGVDL